ncbi:MAG: adenine-specific methyltransferase EcoRI family protein [Pyrinomonadaceae bacterium]
MPNTNLTAAMRAKNDEFFTQYRDIEKEMNAYLETSPDVFRDKTILLPCDDPEWSNFTKYFAQNFQALGLRKLISTSYADASKNYQGNYQPTLFERESPKFDKKRTETKGKIFTLDKDTNRDGKIDVDDLDWEYLSGDGDFRHPEVTKLRDESDVIITNPPFSLFRQFLAWIVEARKEFSIIGNMNAIKYKIVFPLIQENEMWLGPTISSGDREFQVPESYPITAAGWRIDEKGNKFLRIIGVRWFTNLDHGRRHQPLGLMTMADARKFNKKLEKVESAFEKYENYDAIEVPFTDAIPKDWEGLMGVPISFLDKYSPEQFEIVWQASGNTRASAPAEILERMGYSPHPDDRGGCAILNGRRTYDRIFIRHKRNA